MRTFSRVLIPVVILAGCGGLAWWLYLHRPEPDLNENPPALVQVEGATLRKTSHTVIVRSEGSVQPRTRSTLLPEVSGKIVEVEPPPSRADRRRRSGRDEKANSVIHAACVGALL